jgi:cytidine deaminase
MEITNQVLIKKAASVVKAKNIKGNWFADVGCALIAGNNKVYLGVCAAPGSNTFCAEKAAIGAMLTDGEYRIKKLVAVWKDEKGNLFIIPPCGSCRQLIRDLDEKNLETEIILDKNKIVKLKELLPYSELWQKQ